MRRRGPVVTGNAICLGRGRLRDRVGWEPTDLFLDTGSRLPRLRLVAVEGQRDGACRGRLHELAHQPGLLADRGSSRQHLARAGEVPAVAVAGPEPEQRRERCLGSSGGGGDLVRVAEVRLGGLPLGGAPGQDPLENERQAKLTG